MPPSRRAFLQTALASTGLVSCHLSVPSFLQRTAWAAPPAGRPGARDTILVVVEMTGGNDGLNTVIPFKDPEYARLRPTLRIATSELKKINDELGLHPSLGGLAELLEENALGIVQGVGYPNPSQSHFRSMDIWQSGSLAEQISEGWLGRALKGLPGCASFHLKSANEPSPLALEGAPARVPSVRTLQEFQLQLAAASGSDRRQKQAVIEKAVEKPAREADLLGFVQRTAAHTYASSRRLQEIGKNYQAKATYPQTSLGEQLKLAAQLIDADLGARLFYVAIGNFDTHATQAPAHSRLLGQLATAVRAFYKDMKARGQAERILLMTFSEFGRRAKENGSKGTDHGSAAPLFLVGGKVKAGPIGTHPSLKELPLGNLRHHTDFRQVYAAILDGWLGVSSKDVLGESFRPAAIFRS